MRHTSIPITNISNAFDVIVEDTKRAFRVSDLAWLSQKQKRLAARHMMELGALHLREGVEQISETLGRSRSWGYTVVREHEKA